VNFAYTIPCACSAAAVWEALGDTERLIRCIPGCEAVERADAGAAGERRAAPETAAASGTAPAVAGQAGEVYRVRVATGLGPVRLRAAGTAAVRKEAAARAVTAKVSLTDARAGSMYGTMTLEVHPVADGRSELRLTAEVVLAAKMGEFAQPLLRHKADQTARQFARNLTDVLAERP
jgi:uncharacterized protein